MPRNEPDPKRAADIRAAAKGLTDSQIGRVFAKFTRGVDWRGGSHGINKRQIMIEAYARGDHGLREASTKVLEALKAAPRSDDRDLGPFIVSAENYEPAGARSRWRFNATRKSDGATCRVRTFNPATERDKAYDFDTWCEGGRERAARVLATITIAQIERSFVNADDFERAYLALLGDQS